MTARPQYSLGNAGCAVISKNLHRSKQSSPDVTGVATNSGQRFVVTGWVRHRNGRKLLWLGFRKRDKA